MVFEDDSHLFSLLCIYEIIHVVIEENQNLMNFDEQDDTEV